MTGGAVLKAASAGAARRLVPTLVVFVVVTVAAAAGLLGLALATSSNAAFETAFARYHGADLSVTIDAAKVTRAQLAATGHLRGVTRAAGYLATTITLTVPVPADMAASGQVSGRVSVVGRASRSGPLDDIIQKTGRWPTRPGEIDLALYSETRGSIGQVVTATVTSVHGHPKLTVAGYAAPATQDETQEAWAAPGQVAALERAGAPAQEQMLYTFRQAATQAQLSADLSELKAALPAGAIITSVRWLNTEYGHAAQQGTGTPSVAAYAVIGLLLALVITASVVSAAVAASYRRIGVLKSIGFTPAQVAATYLAQLGLPALAGALAGTVLGNRTAPPLIDTGPVRLSVGVPVWVDVSVPLGICALVGLAALVPAARAGRLPAVQAITAGHAALAGGGHAAHRLAARLRLPRPVSLGLAAPFTRPAPSLATTAVITSGLAAVVLAVGLDAQMASIVLSIGHATTDVSLIRRLTWLVAVVAGLGVFSAVLMLARERVHDLGVFKALGMTPRQVIAMVTCWVIAPTIAAAVIALPAGVALEGVVARAVISGQAGRLAQLRLPGGAHRPRRAQVMPPGGTHRPIVVPPEAHPGPRSLGAHPGLAHVYNPGALTLLALAGLAIAIAGALGPAVWAAASRTTTALRAE